MSSGCRRRMIRLPGTGGTTGTGRTGGSAFLGCAVGVPFSGSAGCGVDCEKKALIPWPVEAFRLSVSSVTCMGGRLLAIDDLLDYCHICLCPFMIWLFDDERGLVPG